MRCDAYHGELMNQGGWVDRSCDLTPLGNSGTKHERNRVRDLTERHIFIHYIHIQCTNIHPHTDYPKICWFGVSGLKWHLLLWHMKYIYIYSRGTYFDQDFHGQSIGYRNLIRLGYNFDQVGTNDAMTHVLVLISRKI